MDKKYCKRCNATKSVECFNEKNIYCIRCLEKYRERYNTNKEKQQEKWKKYYDKMKDEKVECELCNCQISKLKWSRHLETKKHRNNLENQNKDGEEE